MLVAFCFCCICARVVKGVTLTEGSGASSSNGSGSGGQVAPFTGFSLAKLAPAGMDPKFVNFFDQLFQGQNMMVGRGSTPMTPCLVVSWLVWLSFCWFVLRLLRGF